MQERTVLLADLIQSRKSADRYETQRRLLDVIEFLNQTYGHHLVKKVEVSSGDSFQGLFDRPSSAFLYLRIAQMLIYPDKVRAGIGLGSLAYMDEAFGSNLLDGEAYHYAREAVDEIRGLGREMLLLKGGTDQNLQFVSLNMMLMMYFELKEVFGANSLRISLVNELLNPMSVDGHLHYLENLEDSERLILEEIILNSFARKSSDWKKVVTPTRPVLPANDIQSFSLQEHCKDGKIRYNSSDFVLRGIQDDVAKVIGTSRQNVQKYYAKGVADERMYTATLIKLLDEVVQ